MSDYKELIDKLRFYADTADDPIYGICINSPNVMLQAADVIEQLVKEYKELDELNDSVCSEYRKVKKERDAAIDCIYAIEDALDRGNDNDWAREHIDEWRKVQEYNDEID